MEPNQKEPKSGRSDGPVTPRKPYTPPEVLSLGRMSDRTLGINGSRPDPGHDNNTKFGFG
jgi:hypothetical protein